MHVIKQYITVYKMPYENLGMKIIQGWGTKMWYKKTFFSDGYFEKSSYLSCLC